jgi:hypothetical protein
MKSALRVRVPRSNARFRDTQFDPNNARHTSRDLDGLAYQGLANAAPTVFGPNVESPNSRTRSGRPNQTDYPDQVRIEHSNDDRSIFRGSGREALSSGLNLRPGVGLRFRRKRVRIRAQRKSPDLDE